ncbi:MAG: hypothetical protein V2I97_14875 [Desulfococcaceae bacterium]|nr:hypothetical protein [Desulfococcaceae bacterium]
MRKISSVIWQAIMFTVLLTVFHAYAESVPPYINYQGRITETDGKGITGQRKLEFNIYDAVQNGNKVWGPQIFQTVDLIDGYFNIILGQDSSGKSVSLAFTGANRFLGIKVNDGTEITPRQQVLSTPYALRSNDPPIGTINAWHKTLSGTSALPSNWVECNGQILNDPESPYNGSQIPNLNTPNLFLRGGLSSGTTGGIDKHSHSYSGITDYALAGGELGERYKNDQATRTHHRHNYSGTTAQTSHIPPYFSVVWIIRVK